MENLNLLPGQMMLVNAKGVNGGKVALEFAQVVETGKESTSLTGLLNASDDRFNQSKPRRAWHTGQPEDIKKIFGVDVSGLGYGEILEIGQLDPKVNDKPLNIQIAETTDGTEYDVANFETRAKRAGKDGEFITTAKGEYIYQKLDVVVGEAKHRFIEETVRQGASASDAAKSAIDREINS
jgi:hypothetical protein